MIFVERIQTFWIFHSFRFFFLFFLTVLDHLFHQPEERNTASNWRDLWLTVQACPILSECPLLLGFWWTGSESPLSLLLWIACPLPVQCNSKTFASHVRFQLKTYLRGLLKCFALRNLRFTHSFFVVLACQLLIGTMDIFKPLFTFFLADSLINLSNIDNFFICSPPYS